MSRLDGKRSLRERVLAGETVFGTFYKSNSAPMMEVIGYAGFDFVVIDCEHSAIGYELVESIIRFGDAVGLDTVVRVPSASEENIFHALDGGAAGVQIPNLTSVEQFEEASKNAKYFPLGTRGLSRNQRAARFGFWPAGVNYTEYANENTLVAVHIENVQMAERADEILKIPQIDVLFVGPADMSQSMGIPGKATDPRVVEVATRVIQKARAAGKGAGIFVGNPAGLERYVAAGANYILYSSDVTLFGSACKNAAAEFAKYRK